MSKPFKPSKNRLLTQVSEKTYMPLTWLESLVPTEMKLLPSPYLEYPFYRGKIENVSVLQEYVDSHKEDGNKIGIISSDEGLIIPKKDTAIRNTYNILPDDSFLDSYNTLMQPQKSAIERYFNVSIIGSGTPQILLYYKGCFYIRHSDNCSEIIDKQKRLVGFKPVALHRKLTTVLFLSSYMRNPKGEFEFNGGDLSFDFLFDAEMHPIKLRPQSGELVSFFSNPYFSHSVKSVTSGLRVSIAQWHNIL